METFGGYLGNIWGTVLALLGGPGDLFGIFGRSGAHFEAGTFKKGGGDFGGVAFGPEKWP